MFALQNAPQRALELPGLTLSPVERDNEAAHFDLTLQIVETEQGLAATFVYNTDLFEAATIVRMLGHFQTLVEALVADPDQRLSHLPLLTETERQQLLMVRGIRVFLSSSRRRWSERRTPSPSCSKPSS